MEVGDWVEVLHTDYANAGSGEHQVGALLQVAAIFACGGVHLGKWPLYYYRREFRLLDLDDPEDCAKLMRWHLENR